jgi:hypothetical protein
LTGAAPWDQNQPGSGKKTSGDEYMPNEETPRADAAQVPEIRIWIDPGRASADDIRALLSSLNELHVALGGFGFTFTVEREYQLQYV